VTDVWAAFRIPAEPQSQQTDPWAAFRVPGPTASTIPQQSYIEGLGRQALQGVSLGFGDELVAAGKTQGLSGLETYLASINPGAALVAGGKALYNAATGAKTPTYDEALARERELNKEFSTENPIASTVAQIAGSVPTAAIPLGTLPRGAGMARQMLLGAGQGAAMGAATGFGVGEGGVENRLGSAAVGAGVGAGIGAALPPAIGAVSGIAGRFVNQARGTEPAAQLYLADRLIKSGVSPADIATDLARGRAAKKFSGGDASLPETIADVTPTTQRVLRGIKVGGDADDIIEPVLSRRQGGDVSFAKNAPDSQYSRLTEDLRLALKEPGEAVGDRLTKLKHRQSKEAQVNYKAAFNQPDPFDVTPVLTAYSLEAMNLVDPKQRAILNRAMRYFDPQGGTGKGANFGAATLERFDKGKQALDDLIESAAAQNQYGNANNLGRLLTRMKHDLLDAVHAPNAKGDPTANAAYFKARQSYATAAELRQAAKDGASYAKGGLELTEREWRGMSEAEKSMFRAAWRNATVKGMGDKVAGPTADFTTKLRTPNTMEEIRQIMPPTAGKSAQFPGGNREKLAEIIKREARMSDTARKILGNSSTAEKAIDAIDIGKMAKGLRYISEKGGAINAATSALSDALERMTAMRGDRARYLAKKLLSSDEAEITAFLDDVQRIYGSRAVRAVRSAVDDLITKSAAAAGSRESLE